MSEIFSFNPITGQLDLVSTTTASGVSDNRYLLESEDLYLQEDGSSYLLLESAT